MNKLIYGFLFTFSAIASADYNSLARLQAQQTQAQREATAQAESLARRDRHAATLRNLANSFAKSHGGFASQPRETLSEYDNVSRTSGWVVAINFELRDRQNSQCVARFFYAGGDRTTPGVRCKYQGTDNQVHDGAFSFPESYKRPITIRE